MSAEPAYNSSSLLPALSRELMRRKNIQKQEGEKCIDVISILKSTKQVATRCT